jgi:DNA-binding NarL/FixJ family response regulator
MNIKILLADDHKIMRDGLRAMLDKEAGLEVVGEADNGRSALSLARDLKPDVVIMDIAMPDLNGIEATRELAGELIDTKVIALSMHTDRRFVFEMLRAGASGYLLKSSAFEELATAIKLVMSNRTFLSSNILDTVVKDYVNQRTKSNSPAYSRLSDRERQVLQLIAEGNSTKEISFLLNVSTKTVESHRNNIMNKLEIHSLAGLTKFAVREGLTTLES